MIIQPQIVKFNSINFKGQKIIKPLTENISTTIEKYTYPTPVLNNIKKINIDDILKLKITNLRSVENIGVRGETLSASRNSKYLSVIKNKGIDTVIDLRTADYTPKFEEKCKKAGLKYVHLPIDSKSLSDREILDNLPKLFNLLEKGKFYIACAQGRHRTDIALALNYIFNPKSSSVPPKMYGHIKENEFKCEDIFRRVNSLYKSMTIQDKAKLGWSEEFERNFITRKKNLKSFNERFILPH